MRSRLVAKRFSLYLIASLLCVVLVLPILWMLSCSFKTVEELYSASLSLIPRMPTLKNYVEAFKDYTVSRWLFNSGIVALGITLGQLLTSILAGYGFARFNFPAKNVLFITVIGTMIVPFAATMIPNYILISSLGGINTYWGVIIPNFASGFGIFLIRQHMMSIPHDLFDAAKIDGANSWNVLWHVAVPLTKGSIIALTVLLGLNAWNIYFWPMLILTELEMQTLPIGLSNFTDPEFGIVWGALMAAASVASLLALAFYAIGQKHILGSFAISGLKG
jgi:ABC-type glycerol-3-phosphate transport system permease component